MFDAQQIPGVAALVDLCGADSGKPPCSIGKLVRLLWISFLSSNKGGSGLYKDL